MKNGLAYILLCVFLLAAEIFAGESGVFRETSDFTNPADSLFAHPLRAQFTGDGQKNRRALNKSNGSCKPYKIIVDNFHIYTYSYDNNGNLKTLVQSGNVQTPGDVRRTNYIYDENGNLISETIEEFNFSASDTTADKWYFSWRYTYSYDSRGNCLRKLLSNYYKDEQKWKNYEGDIFTYDDNGNMLSHQYEYYSIDDSAGAYMHKETFTYDAAGNLITRLMRSFSENSWRDIERYTYAYDSKNRIVSSFRELCERGIWRDLKSEIYTYDESGKMLKDSSYHYETMYAQIFKYEYNDLGDTLSISIMDVHADSTFHGAVYKFSYDDKRRRTSVVQSYVTSAFSSPRMRYTYTYDEHDNLISQLLERMDDSPWVNLSLNSYTYDGKNNLLCRITDVWNQNKWTKSDSLAYMYDSYGNTTSGEYFYIWNNLIKEYKRYNFVINYDCNKSMVWNNHCSVQVQYLDITGVEENPSVMNSFELFQNYPNPFNPSTAIMFSLPEVENVSLEIFNSLGQRVETLLKCEELGAGRHQVNWNAAGRSSGVYFYQLKARDRVSVRKMLLLK